MKLMFRIQNGICDRIVKIFREADNPEGLFGWRPNLAPLFLATREK